MARRLASLIPVLALPTLAHAQPGAATPAPDVVPVEAVPAVAAPGTVTPGAFTPAAAVATPADPDARTGIERLSAEDAAADRAYLARTALVAPAGTVTWSTRAPLFPVGFSNLSLSLSDRIEVGVGSLVVIEEGAVFSGNVKVQLLRSKTAALAVSIDHARFDLDQEQSDGVTWGQVVASWCTDGEACNSLLSFHVNALVLEDEDDMPVLGGVSYSTGKKHRFVAEAHTWRDDGDEALLLGYFGGRFGNKAHSVAVDAGIAFALLFDDGDDVEGAPYPFLGLSARM